MPRITRTESGAVAAQPVATPGGTVIANADSIVAALAVRRRCGTRHERSVYIEAGPSRTVAGLDTLSACLFDPPLTLNDVGAPNWYEPHRTPITFRHDGVTHFAVWVGESYYPCVHDFIEEVRAANASRKLPPNFDFANVTERSRMFFIHPRARVTLERSEDFDGETRWAPVSLGSTVQPCRLEHALYDAERTVHDDEDQTPRRMLPCGHAYQVRELPEGCRVAAEPGIFMQLPITGIALVNDRSGAFPPEVEERVRRSRVPVFRTNA